MVKKSKRRNKILWQRATEFAQAVEKGHIIRPVGLEHKSLCAESVISALMNSSLLAHAAEDELLGYLEQALRGAYGSLKESENGDVR